MGKTFFITGTGTDVGKTALSLAVVLWARHRGLRASYFKPIQCGEFPFGEPAVRGGDADWIRNLAGTNVRTQGFYRFRMAASPHLAAEHEGERIDRSLLSAQVKALSVESDLVIVEGSGGAAVPLDREGTSLAAWAADLGMPALIACAPGLGTLHHTLTTVAYLRGLAAPIAGFAFCHRGDGAKGDEGDEGDEREVKAEGNAARNVAWSPSLSLIADNRETLRSLTGLAFFGSLPFSMHTSRGIPMPSSEAEAWWAPLSASLDSWWGAGRA
ncbi:MAG: dethiobiotin synthase [Fibrobacteria bacterium]